MKGDFKSMEVVVYKGANAMSRECRGVESKGQEISVTSSRLVERIISCGLKR